MIEAVANHVPLSPISFLNRSADVFGDEIGIVTADEAGITYSRFRSRAATLAKRIRETGLGSGDCVAVLAPNDFPLLEAHFGIPAAGCVLLALNSRLSHQEYSYILGHSQARLVIVDQELSDQLGPVKNEAPDVSHVLEIGDAEPSSAADGSYEDWLSEDNADLPLSLPKNENQPISLNYTSGTTGNPKGVIYTHRGAYLNALGQALSLGLDYRSRYLWTLPMFHCNGWCFPWAVTAAGGRHVCLRTFDPAVALNLINRYDVTHFCGAPVVLNSMISISETQNNQLRHRVKAATGGAPPSPAVIGRMQELGVDVVHLYGLTETYGPSLVCQPKSDWKGLGVDDLAARMARQGVRTVNVEDVRVMDEEMVEVPPDGTTVGEIVLQSNTVMQGYLDDEPATAEAFRGGWFHTADLAVRHPDGYIEIKDRAKDIIISGGENISSIEVENAISSHPSILEVAVVAAPDAKWGEIPVAFVTLKPGASLSETEVVSWVRDRIAHFKAPKMVRFQELPKTSTGKIRKTELRETLEAPVSRADQQ